MSEDAEENSLLLDYGNAVVELPAMDLVLYKPLELLGPQVYSRFGAEFPIRFDFLDTIGGQNLSLQVHPVTEYMHRQFGMAYHELEFIETRRYWITDEVVIQPEHNVNMLNLVEGTAAVIDSPEGEFAPFMVHYAETFIIPAGVKNIGLGQRSRNGLPCFGPMCEFAKVYCVPSGEGRCFYQEGLQ